MTNLIMSLIDIVAPFAGKPRLVAAMFIAVLAIGPNVALAQTVNETSDVSLLTIAAEQMLGPEKPMTVQETLLAVCRERGYGEECAKTLTGMASVESDFKGNAIGDRGRARGWFQIWYKLHNISLACAEDLRCSANWTIDYLEGNGYPKHVTYAVQCHNGCNMGNDYYPIKVKRRANFYWDKKVTLAMAEAK